MILFKEAAPLSKHISKLRDKGNSIGFAPTMGALHSGHISLIEKSKTICDITVSSIFVNPTQFNDPKDFEKYPVTIGSDISALESAGCDILFIPSVSEIYPAGIGKAPHYDLGEIELLLEGRFRPGHFQGVCQVVHRLLDIVKPGKLFMGQKDYQQCIVVKKLVQLLNLPIDVITVGTYREESGLAMSSRNLRLSKDEKLEAAAIFKMLQYIKENRTTNPHSTLENYAANYLIKSGFRAVDYVSIADAKTLQPTSAISEGIKRVALIAAFIGDVRLIDNLLLDE
ncbi:pantoate--beta-alanine ligase [Segetibacter sp.]|jgi:pantoate--beta-alanine ligase|uniref:pantoate--beta-alanine ligase n=1 Tax=Segetibacter sp. TaxID=2231182 RepID=UPI002638E386|nr:pantoate--beta-alanine ligase [Segetibacter sp.]MCW3081622.1 pantoate--beta-alanine ligase [Segetibacter sp.]